MTFEGRVPASVQQLAQSLEADSRRRTQQMIDDAANISKKEPIHIGTLILPTITQILRLADSISAANQYAADHGDETLRQMLQQIKSQMDDLHPRFIESGEDQPTETTL
jgi:molecular chaperone GrpE (heat shock protein)